MWVTAKTEEGDACSFSPSLPTRIHPLPPFPRVHIHFKVQCFTADDSLVKVWVFSFKATIPITLLAVKQGNLELIMDAVACCPDTPPPPPSGLRRSFPQLLGILISDNTDQLRLPPKLCPVLTRGHAHCPSTALMQGLAGWCSGRKARPLSSMRDPSNGPFLCHSCLGKGPSPLL